MTDTNLILITRPEKDSADFSEDVQGLGFQAMIEPMLEIVFLDFEAPGLSSYQGLIFTSANGVRAFCDQEEIRDISVYVVGKNTQAECYTQGFKQIFTAEGTAENLAELIRDKAIDKTKPLLHVRGEHVALAIEEDLKEEDIEVDVLTVYSAHKVEEFSPGLVKALKEGHIQAISFFSRRTAENFINLIDKHDLQNTLNTIKCLCIRDSMLESVRSELWTETYTAQTPDRQGMLALIQTECA